MKCERFNRNKDQCQREAKYHINVIGYDFQVCWWHKLTNPITTLIANIQIKYEFWKDGCGTWGLFDGVFTRKVK